MAGRSRRLTFHRSGRALSDQDLAAAVPAIFTHEEIAEWFREWEATLVEAMNKALEQAKRAREAEFGIPTESTASPAGEDSAGRDPGETA